MFKRFAYGFLVLAGGLLSSGCCVMSPYGVCDPAVGCGDCGDVAVGCDTCGECQPGSCYHPWLWPRASRALTCGAGCGEVYYGEWMSDPPACDDPCDSCGEVSCGGCYGCWNPLRGLAHLWGYRYAPGDCGVGCEVGCDVGCDSCLETYDSEMPDEMYLEEAEEKAEEEKLPAPKPEPVPAKQASAKRPVKKAKVVPASHKTIAVRRK
ncbi:MAG: hypothetical protein GX575_19320 [Candidatus Anammoximicrobium sp.]|nr:hypothetical protein [Candidatus Anammoximicrobium sp.]